MVKKETRKKKKITKWDPRNLKEVMTHIVAMFFIIPLVALLVWSAFDKTIEVPSLLIALGSSAAGFYLSRYMKF